MAVALDSTEVTARRQGQRKDGTGFHPTWSSV
jgi:hypothetical protein